MGWPTQMVQDAQLKKWKLYMLLFNRSFTQISFPWNIIPTEARLHMAVEVSNHQLL